MCVCVCVSY